MPMKKTGSRAEVWGGAARETAGGLKKADLFKDPKTGMIKSKRVSAAAKARNPGGPFKKAAGVVLPGGAIPGNLQAAGVVLPGGAIPGNLQAAGVVLPGASRGGAFGGALFGAGVVLPGGGMAGAGMDAAKAKAFIEKVLKAIAKVSPKIRKVINSQELQVVADMVTDALVQSGMPKAQIAGATIAKLLPVVKKVIGRILDLVDATQKKGAGIMVPGY